jgi:hypothetical protein
MGDKENAFRFLVGESEAKKTLRRLRRRMGDKIKTNSNKTRVEGAGRIHLVPEMCY